MNPTSVRCALWALLLTAQGAAALSLDAAEIRRLGVRTVSAQAAERLSLGDQPGMVRVPNAGLTLIAAPVDGLVVRMAVAEGDVIRPDAALAELAGPEVARLEASYVSAALADRVAHSELQRTRGLVTDGVLARRVEARAEVERSRAAEALEVARSTLMTAGLDAARLAELEVNATPRDRLVLRAPWAGTVLRQFATPGERLTAGAPILEIGQLDRLWVETHVAIERTRGFRPGDRARVDAGAGRRLSGRIITIGRRVHEADRGLLVRVEVEDPEAQLIPGQSVQVTLERDAMPGSTRVPHAALVMLGSRPVVFRRHADEFVAVAVRIEADTDTGLVLSGELEAGAAVVVEGTSALRALLEAESP